MECANQGRGSQGVAGKNDPQRNAPGRCDIICIASRPRIQGFRHWRFVGPGVRSLIDGDGLGRPDRTRYEGRQGLLPARTGDGDPDHVAVLPEWRVGRHAAVPPAGRAPPRFRLRQGAVSGDIRAPAAAGDQTSPSGQATWPMVLRRRALRGSVARRLRHGSTRRSSCATDGSRSGRATLLGSTTGFRRSSPAGRARFHPPASLVS